ncbi:TIM21-domain-containing protein [Massariosphaeria phaeospora]|uniref:Mitochondrial import inner membrane translocase subunit Tim21 n=1 Tax=Massariosphaeria phaeospora TaxID=100035 RepID=A0A7C8IEP1_9PLEO|nr:TIM21-domain-containing protein [Massariosphaeria phaeospora]
MAAIHKPTEVIQLLRPAIKAQRMSRPDARPSRVAFSTCRITQATHSSTPSPITPSAPPPRRRVTVTNDTGSVRWSELSPAEKAARTTQQSFNFVVVITGLVLGGGVCYYLFTDVFSPSSKTAQFNRATTRIRQSSEVQALLGEGSQISAFGEPSWSRLARNRYISHTLDTDQWGTEHMRFRFYVEGPLGQGVVHVHLTKRPSQNNFEYHTLAVDVKGHQRVYVENAEEKKESKIAPKIFGARWW